MSEIAIRAGSIDEAGEILTLQRAAYLTEAQIYGTTALPPLTQTLEELEAELADVLCYVAVDGSRIIGAVRLAVRGSVGEIARLVVAPDWQGQGVGTRLVSWVEEFAPAEVARFELFTGHRSMGNLALYNRLGYSAFRRQRSNDSITLVFLAKSRL